MKKYKITGEITADSEEDARFKATIEGGNGILEFEEIKEIKETDLRNKLVELIKKNEEQGGIFVNELKAKIKDSNLDSEIIKLLEEGIIFEPRPSKLRYLG